MMGYQQPHRIQMSPTSASSPAFELKLGIGGMSCEHPAYPVLKRLQQLSGVI